ncbi:MAG: O-methyltransferase [Actinomycetes bacterium]
MSGVRLGVGHANTLRRDAGERRVGQQRWSASGPNPQHGDDRVGAFPREAVISTERTTGQGASAGTAASPAVRQYIDDFRPEDDVLAAARSRGDEIGARAVTPATGAILQWLAQFVHARNVAEVGTGVGISGVWLLRGMADDGILTTVDDEAENTRAARQAFADAGVPPQRTRLITGRPLEVLSRLADTAYDMVFLNGETQETARYLDDARRLLRPGGLIVIDRVLAEGRVPDPAQRDADAIAMRTLLSEVSVDEQVRPLLLPVGGGLLVAQKIRDAVQGADAHAN